MEQLARKPQLVEQLSVVIPTYNERENIEILVPQIQVVFEDHAIDGEIVIVDDQSSDGSAEVFKKLQDEYPNLVIEIRQGTPSIARAWYEGFDLASKSNVVCIDADLCHDPKYFPKMLEQLHNYDIVIGSRYLTQEMMMEDKSLAATYTSFFGQYLTRLATGFKETDTSHSFRMFKKEVFSSIKDRLHNEGNVFLIEFLIHAKRNNYSVTEIPIHYGKRIHGETKLKVFREGVRYLRFISKILLTRIR